MNGGLGIFLLKRSEHVAHAVGLAVGDRVARAIDANMLEFDSHSTAFGLRARAQMRHDCSNVFLTRRLARSELRIARSSCFPHKVLISLPRSTTPTRCHPSCGPKPCMAPMVTRTRLFRREHKTISRRRCQLVGEHDKSPALNSRRTHGFGRGLQTRRTMAFKNGSNCATFYHGAQETPDSTLYCVSHIFAPPPRIFKNPPMNGEMGVFFRCKEYNLCITKALPRILCIHNFG